MWNIIKKHITANFAKNTAKPVYIVVHDTGNPSPKADADAHYRYFCGKGVNASYNYVCDDRHIIECVEPPNAAYHAGVGKSGLRKDGKRSAITNYNSIGVSYCINRDGDIKKAAMNAAVAVAYACIKYSIPLENVVRHYDVTEKLCPGTMMRNEVGLAENHVPWGDFEAFKEKVAELIAAMKETESICKKLKDKGYITNEEYWLNGLAGIGEIDAKWLRVMLGRMVKDC